MPCNCIQNKMGNLKLKTRPKQLLGSLPLAFALPASRCLSFSIQVTTETSMSSILSALYFLCLTDVYNSQFGICNLLLLSDHRYINGRCQSIYIVMSMASLLISSKISIMNQIKKKSGLTRREGKCQAQQQPFFSRHWPSDKVS